MAWALLLAPSIHFLLSGWPSRRGQLLGLFTPKAINSYYRLFFPAEKAQDNKATLELHFWRKFNERYGRRHYLCPLIVLGLVAGVGIGVATLQITSWLGYFSEPKLLPIPAVAISAFLGGYAWAVSDQLGRFRSQDFTIHDVYACTYRLIISIPVGISLAALLKDQAGVPVAFLLGAFPTHTLFKIARRVASQKLGLGETKDDGPTELSRLQGVGRANGERFQEEGFTTVTELAWSDPVQLTIRTNFDFNYIVDCVSQALLWVYFGAQTHKLYSLSLRGAQEVRSMLDDLHGKNRGAKSCAEATVAAGAGILNMAPDAFLSTLSQAAEDPYTIFLTKVWAE